MTRRASSAPPPPRPEEPRRGGKTAPDARPRVFLSYSWKNKALRDSLLARLQEAQYDVRVDDQYFENGSELNQGLVVMLCECDVMVVLFTRAAARSKAVAEELVRAHSLFVKIYALVEKGARTALPWFLRNKRFHEYAEGDAEKGMASLIESMRRDQSALRGRAAGRLVREQLLGVRRLLNRETSDSLLEAKMGVARAALEVTRDEIHALDTNFFTAVVGSGPNFLRRARPIFQNATKVYAVSLDSVSRFWTSRFKAEQRLAIEYLAAHPRATRRLFVFSSPESAHDYATILNMHARHYGDSGRVFLASLEAYTRLLAELGLETNHQNDFAVLEYQADPEPVMFKATLDGDRFMVMRELSANPLPDLKPFAQFLNGLDDLQPAGLDESGIMRWQVDLQMDHGRWSKRLKDIFVDRNPDWFHFVFFSREALADERTNRQVQDIVAQLRLLLDKLRETHSRVPNAAIRLKDFWFGESSRAGHQAGPAVRAHVHHESADYPFMLMMRFDDESSLHAWYSDGDHLKLKRDIYAAFSPELESICATLDAMTVTEQAHAHETLEQQARIFLRRRDYSQADTIDDIVRRREFRPSVSSERGRRQ